MRYLPCGLLLLLVASPGSAAVLNQSCDGDFNVDGFVTVEELVAAVGSALHGCTQERCAGDSNADHRVTIDELVTAVANALRGYCCPWDFDDVGPGDACPYVGTPAASCPLPPGSITGTWNRLFKDDDRIVIFLDFDPQSRWTVFANRITAKTARVNFYRTPDLVLVPTTGTLQLIGQNGFKVSFESGNECGTITFAGVL